MFPVSFFCQHLSTSKLRIFEKSGNEVKMYINVLYICNRPVDRSIGLMSSVRQWSGKQGFNLMLSHTKDSKNGT